MKRTNILILVILAALCGPLVAQERGEKTQQKRGGQGGGLLFKTLDADGDGTLSSKEIDNAFAALMKLDKNQDGQLTPDELRSRGGKNREKKQRERP